MFFWRRAWTWCSAWLTHASMTSVIVTRTKRAALGTGPEGANPGTAIGAGGPCTGISTTVSPRMSAAVQKSIHVRDATTGGEKRCDRVRRAQSDRTGTREQRRPRKKRSGERRSKWGKVVWTRGTRSAAAAAPAGSPCGAPRRSRSLKSRSKHTNCLSSAKLTPDTWVSVLGRRHKAMQNTCRRATRSR